MNKKCNKEQENAIRHVDGPCLVLAGPGSGKTFVLTNRIYNLIKNENVNPSNLLVITFTRKAANEMKERFINLLKDENYKINALPTFGTFHSIFFDILKESFLYNSESLIDYDTEKKYLYSALDVSKRNVITDDKLCMVLNDIKAYKLSLEREESYIPKSMSKRKFLYVVKKYSDILYKNKKLDFYDMISKCYELLCKNKEALKYYQNKYRYILIDEFQDINKNQYDIVKLICKTHNLFVVGDDDQSIYKFRGSKPRVMKDFVKDFNKAKIITLVENYRCARRIVKFSNLVISHNKERYDKKIRAYRHDVGKLEIKAFVDSKDENKYIVDEIKRYVKSGLHYKDIAILFRTNILVDSIKNALEKAGIPYNINGAEKEMDDKPSIPVNNDSVFLMTFHLSKGLEYKTVFIIDANDGIIPHSKSIMTYDIETERRLFYVGMTRAKDNLHIFFTVRRFGKNYKASRFILEVVGGNNE